MTLAGFNVPLDTLQVILETIFTANHLIGTKTQSSPPITSKQNLTATKLRHRNLNNNYRKTASTQPKLDLIELRRKEGFMHP